MIWRKRVQSLTDAKFLRRYRIDLQGFNAVLAKIKPHMPAVVPNVLNQLPHELMLSMTLRWCAGGSYLDLCDMHGCGEAAFYTSLWTTLEAVCLSYELQLETEINAVGVGIPSQLTNMASRFERKSSGYFTGCIGALDGIQSEYPTSCNSVAVTQWRPMQLRSSGHAIKATRTSVAKDSIA